ncbi:MAG: nucleoside-diphosphate-sugar epimerase [Saprospiraceae bacterium]|jgi:nucleoside-diphosphate-sugar epimerase
MNTSRRKISIIGCGWLGLPLGAFLVEKGFDIKGSTTSEDKLPILADLNIQPFLIKAGDKLEGENLPDFFDTDILIINIPPRRRRTDVETRHFAEVKNIIDAAVEGSIQKVIFCSSTGIYADENKIVFETDSPNPQTDSTRALVEIENYLLSKNSLQSTILRFSGLIGGDRKAGRFLAGKKNIPNGMAPVNLVHREDCIRVIYEIIRQNIWNEFFNVCADEHPTRKDFYTQQALKQGFELPEFLEEDKAVFKIVSNQKLKARLGYVFGSLNELD